MNPPAALLPSRSEANSADARRDRSPPRRPSPSRRSRSPPRRASKSPPRRSPSRGPRRGGRGDGGKRPRSRSPRRSRSRDRGYRRGGDRHSKKGDRWSAAIELQIDDVPGAVMEADLDAAILRRLKEFRTAVAAVTPVFNAPPPSSGVPSQHYADSPKLPSMQFHVTCTRKPAGAGGTMPKEATIVFESEAAGQHVMQCEAGLLTLTTDNGQSHVLLLAVRKVASPAPQSLGGKHATQQQQATSTAPTAQPPPPPPKAFNPTYGSLDELRTILDDVDGRWGSATTEEKAFYHTKLAEAQGGGASSSSSSAVVGPSHAVATTSQASVDAVEAAASPAAAPTTAPAAPPSSAQSLRDRLAAAKKAQQSQPPTVPAAAVAGVASASSSSSTANPPGSTPVDTPTDPTVTSSSTSRLADLKRKLEEKKKAAATGVSTVTGNTGLVVEGGTPSAPSATSAASTAEWLPGDLIARRLPSFQAAVTTTSSTPSASRLGAWPTTAKASSSQAVPPLSSPTSNTAAVPLTLILHRGLHEFIVRRADQLDEDLKDGETGIVASMLTGGDVFARVAAQS